VSLHQPAAYYGVNSEKLGRGGAALASGAEVLAYFDRVANKWLASGGVTAHRITRVMPNDAWLFDRSHLQPGRLSVRNASAETEALLGAETLNDFLLSLEERGRLLRLEDQVWCQQVFSAAIISHVESAYADEAMQNELCRVVPHPEINRDFIAALTVSGINMTNWGKKFSLWLRRSRLCMLHHEPLFPLVFHSLRQARGVMKSAENSRRILEQEFPGRDFTSPA
jgi:hypothetical protein